ncbi:hypothetical protein SAMN02910453_1647 [Lachnospiraceae bacterium A10]|nr:hypothetical protein SAMN02910453_1647 [Lachnospiraceae bacterium A10]
MKTIESYVQGKKEDQRLCEDGLYIGERLVAVIDGATAQSSRKYDGDSSGCYAKKVLLDKIQQNEEMLLEMDAVDMMRTLNGFLTSALSKEKNELAIEEYPRASVIIYNEKRQEISGYGDCTCMINGKAYEFVKEIDRINSEYRSMVLEYALANGVTVDELRNNDVGRNAIKNTLKDRFVFENKTGRYGYPTLNGYSFNDSMVFVQSINTGDEIVLATDGYPILKATLEESEAELKRLLVEDPLCMRGNQSTKGLVTGSNSFDDRTYWRGIA